MLKVCRQNSLREDGFVLHLKEEAILAPCDDLAVKAIINDLI